MSHLDDAFFKNPPAMFEPAWADSEKLLTEVASISKNELAPKAYDIDKGYYPKDIMAKIGAVGGLAPHMRSQGSRFDVAIDAMRFWHPVHVGDTVCCYAELVRVGRTSITFNITAWATPIEREKRFCVTQALFTYVAIDSDGRPTPITQPVAEA